MARMTRELRDGDSGLGTDFLGPARQCVKVTEPQSQAGHLLVLHFMERGSAFSEVMQLGRAARFKVVGGAELEASVWREGWKSKEARRAVLRGQTQLLPEGPSGPPA